MNEWMTDWLNELMNEEIDWKNNVDTFWEINFEAYEISQPV